MKCSFRRHNYTVEWVGNSSPFSVDDDILLVVSSICKSCSKRQHVRKILKPGMKVFLFEAEKCSPNLF